MVPMSAPANAPAVGGTNPRTNRFITWLKRWWPALLWAVVISGLSTRVFGDAHTSRLILPLLHWLFPAATEAKLLLWHHLIRKSAHIVEYFVFSLLISRAIRLGHPGHRWRWTLVAIGVLTVYATLDEYHQSFVPGRTAAVRDVLLDVAGGAAAQVLAGWLAFWREERRRATVLASKPD
jgi:VanZ family protein